MTREILIQKAMMAYLKKHEAEFEEYFEEYIETNGKNATLDENTAMELNNPLFSILPNGFDKKLLLAFLEQYAGPLPDPNNEGYNAVWLTNEDNELGVLDALVLLTTDNSRSPRLTRSLLRVGRLSSTYDGEMALLCAKRKMDCVKKEISELEEKLKELKEEQKIIAGVCVNLINECWLEFYRGNWRWLPDDYFNDRTYGEDETGLTKDGFPEWCTEFLAECEHFSGRLTQLCLGERNRDKYPEYIREAAYRVSEIDIIMLNTMDEINERNNTTDKDDVDNIKKCHRN